MNRQAYSLTVQPRTLSGRRIKQLRTQSIIPANIYGANQDSQSIQMTLRELLVAYSENGYSGLINIKVEGEKKIQPVLIADIQQHPVTNVPIHIDFKRVNLKEKISAVVPIDYQGESQGVKEFGGIFVSVLEELEVEALPQDLPESIIVDISVLENIGDTLTIGDIKLPSEDMVILAEPDEVLAKIEQPTTQEELDADAEASEGQEVEVIAKGKKDEEGEEGEEEGDSKDEE